MAQPSACLCLLTVKTVELSLVTLQEQQELKLQPQQELKLLMMYVTVKLLIDLQLIDLLLIDLLLIGLLQLLYRTPSCLLLEWRCCCLDLLLIDLMQLVDMLLIDLLQLCNLLELLIDLVSVSIAWGAASVDLLLQGPSLAQASRACLLSWLFRQWSLEVDKASPALAPTRYDYC